MQTSISDSISTQKLNFDVLDLGLCNYREYLEVQQNLFQAAALGSSRSAIILCEHKPVITLGRAGKRKNILKREEELSALGIEIVNVTRGGDVTLHLPGQLVVYPIFDLRVFGKDIKNFLRNLEETMILLLRDYGIQAGRKTQTTGVWVRGKKIVSIGIAISRWITAYGLSLNVNCNLDLFSLIRPCGQDIMMTSMLAVGSPKINMLEIKKKVISKFEKVFCAGG